MITKLTDHVKESIMQSQLTKHQEKKYTKAINNGQDGQETMQVTIRHDDRCGNGHNSFSITASICAGFAYTENKAHSFGCLHNEIAKHFPELEQYIKWHLCSTDGPMHYIANTTYHAQNGNLEYARSTAVWPEATLEDLKNVQLLEMRLPALLDEFRSAVESLGFTY